MKFHLYKPKILLLFLMGLFSLFNTKANGQQKFVTEKEFKKNLEKQTKMTPETLTQLKKHGIGDTKELRLEFFFYTNSQEKAKKLAEELTKMKYEVNFEKAVDAPKQFVITGWTPKMKMSESIVVNWTRQMCELGYRFDCDFDGWGTNPDQ